MGRWPGSRRNARREEVILVRIRLGHRYLTHSYLLKREDEPECVGCACPLTVQHIMIDCVEFAYTRSRFFDVRNMKDSMSPPSQSFGAPFRQISRIYLVRISECKNFKVRDLAFLQQSHTNTRSDLVGRYW